MSASLEASLRLEISQYQAALAKAEGSLLKFKNAAIQTGRGLSTMTGTKSGGGLRNLGQVSMQLQDVAVQMQSGVKMSTILAQQGSQVLSVFGPAGAVAGGLIAVGGLLYSMRQASQQAIAAIQEDAANLDATFRVLSAGGIVDMINGMEKMKKVSDTLKGEVNAPPGILETGYRFFTGQRSDQEEVGIKSDAARKNEETRDKLIKQILNTSKDELKIVQLRAYGQTEEAERLERKLAMAKELAKIEDAPVEVRAALQADIRAKYAAQELQAQKQKADEAAREAKEAEKAAKAKRDSRMDLLAEIKDLQLRASGKEREADIAKEAARIQEQTGISEQLALAAAREIIRLKEKAAALDNKSSASGSGEKSGRKKIVSARDGTTFAKQSGRFGTLDDYYALQQKREVTLDERFATRKARGGGAGLPIGQSTALVPVSNNSLSGRRPGGIPVAGRFGIDGGSLSDRATRAASQQDRTGEGPTGGATLDDVIKVLQAGLL